jgi:hypothetical protein
MKYIELSYCDMPYMLKNQKCIKRNNRILYPFEEYAFIKITKGINKLHCLYPSYKTQILYEEKAKELFNSDLSNEEKKQKSLEIINEFIEKVIKEN